MAGKDGAAVAAGRNVGVESHVDFREPEFGLGSGPTQEKGTMNREPSTEPLHLKRQPASSLAQYRPYIAYHAP